MSARFSPQLIIALLSDAKRQFGPPSTWNRQEVALWLRIRVEEITSGEGPRPADIRPFVPRGFDDVKARQAGDEI